MALLGMRGTGDWSNEERPKNFREGILRLYPNGSTPLTAITSKGTTKPTDDPEYKWWQKNLEAQGGAFTATEIYNHSDLQSGNKITGVIASGTTVYVKVAAAIAAHFRPGHAALLLISGTDASKTYGKVVGVHTNGASSWVSINTRVTGVGNCESYNYIDIVGNINSEGGVSPDSVSYEPTKYSNYTQIFRTPLDITRTQKKTKMRTGDVYAEVKEESYRYHGIEMEMAIMLGEKSETTGSNGKPERTTQGAIPFLAENYSGNILDYPSSTSLTWRQGGEDWFDEKMKTLFEFGQDTRLALAGNGAILGIMKLVKMSSHFSLTVETLAYGVKVMRWVTPFGEIMIKRAPLMTHKTYLRNNMLILDPANVIWRTIDDTNFLPDTRAKEGGYQKIDGLKEEWLTEAGCEWHYPETMMYLKGVGSDGTA